MRNSGVRSGNDSRKVIVWKTLTPHRTRLLYFALAAVLASARPAAGYCPPGFLCDPETTGIQTSGTASGVQCDTMNSGTVDFGALPKGTSQSVTKTVCICPTDQYFATAGSTGIEFLGINSSNAEDFTIVASGIVTNGVPQEVPGSGGCKVGPFFDPPGFPGCAGNPQIFCYARVKFQPVEYGTFNPEVQFGMACPGTDTPPVPRNCTVFPPGATFDYQALPIKLTASGTGFGMLQPTINSAFQLSAPTSTSDPGSPSPQIVFQAQAGSSDTVTWTTNLRYKPTDHKEVQAITRRFTTVGTATATPSPAYSGEGGFLVTTALIDKAESCVVTPITGWDLGSSTGCTTVSQSISSELKTLYQNIAVPNSVRPYLLERLSFSESSYRQFFTIPLNTPPIPPKKMCSGPATWTGLWPHENSPNPPPPKPPKVKRGDYIGLLQVPVAPDTAWNWITNVQKGAKEFAAKLKTAQHYQNNREAEDSPGPPDLSPSQTEDIQMGLYKGFGDTWFWVPQCSTSTPSNPVTKGKCPNNGSWKWVQNPNPCRNGGTNCMNPDNVIVTVNSAETTAAPCEQ